MASEPNDEEQSGEDEDKRNRLFVSVPARNRAWLRDKRKSDLDELDEAQNVVRKLNSLGALARLFWLVLFTAITTAGTALGWFSTFWHWVKGTP